MAIARTGVFVDDYLEYSSSLHAEIQRHLSTMTELDIRANTMMQQNREDTKACLYLPTAQIHKPQSDEQQEFERLKKEIEANQENILSLCTEKVLLAQQACDLIDSHMKRLDEDLNQFADDLKQEGKISPDEPAILPMVPLHEKRKSTFFGPPAKRIDTKLDRDDRDTELMPPPASHKKRSLPTPDVDQPVDPNEPRYCICNQVSFGDMIACDNDNCTGGEWFHYQCVGLTPETRFKNKWYCPKCKELQKRGLSEAPA